LFYHSKSEQKTNTLPTGAKDETSKTWKFEALVAPTSLVISRTFPLRMACIKSKVVMVRIAVREVVVELLHAAAWVSVLNRRQCCKGHDVAVCISVLPRDPVSLQMRKSAY
jgi:hypothetical protein